MKPTIFLISTSDGIVQLGVFNPPWDFSEANNFPNNKEITITVEVSLGTCLPCGLRCGCIFP